MKEKWNQLKNHLRKLKADLKPMTFKEKADHLWTYYKWVAVVLCVIIVITMITVSSIRTANQETLLSGMLINADVSLDGFNYLTDDYFAHRNGIEDDQVVKLSSIAFHDPLRTTEIDYAYTAISKFTAEMADRDLDYVIMDQLGLDHCCIANQALYDLRDILTEEELAQLAAAGDLIYAEIRDEDDVLEDTMPIAINMRNMAYSQRFIQSEYDIYFGFIDNTQRLDACRDLWAYLQALETE